RGWLVKITMDAIAAASIHFELCCLIYGLLPYQSLCGRYISSEWSVNRTRDQRGLHASFLAVDKMCGYSHQCSVQPYLRGAVSRARRRRYPCAIGESRCRALDEGPWLPNRPLCAGDDNDGNQVAEAALVLRHSCFIAIGSFGAPPLRLRARASE